MNSNNYNDKVNYIFLASVIGQLELKLEILDDFEDQFWIDLTWEIRQRCNGRIMEKLIDIAMDANLESNKLHDEGKYYELDLVDRPEYQVCITLYERIAKLMQYC